MRIVWISTFTIFFTLLPISTVAGENKVSQLVSKGNDLYLEGDFKKAQEAYQEALLLSVENTTKGKIHYNLGNTYYRLGELKKSLKEYEEALRLNPEDRDAKFNFEVVLRALQGEEKVLLKDPSRVEETPEDLSEEITFILQKLEQEEFNDPQGIPMPPTPTEKIKDYKRDW